MNKSINKITDQLLLAIEGKKTISTIVEILNSKDKTVEGFRAYISVNTSDRRILQKDFTTVEEARNQLENWDAEISHRMMDGNF